MLKHKKLLKPWQIDAYLRVLSKSYPINTNMAGFRRISKILTSLCVIWTQVASALMVNVDIQITV